jgi:hypothetical protein
VKAISIEEKRVHIMTCLSYTARTPLMSKLRFFILSKLQPESAARLMKLRAFDKHTFHVCSKCVALCPYGEDTLQLTPSLQYPLNQVDVGAYRCKWHTIGFDPCFRDMA